jgi:hypothetical protein
MKRTLARVVIVMLVLLARSAAADDAPGRTQNMNSAQAQQLLQRFMHPTPRLYPGAIELGIGLSAVTIEGSSRWTLGVRAGSFNGVGDGLLGYEVDFDYTHVSELDVLDVQGQLTWQRSLGAGVVYPFLAVGGGPREEWIGSFRQARWPVGAGLGVRVLAGDRAAMRAEYRYRRILNDPVADFSEHQLWVSFSVLFHNRPKQ